MQGGRRPFLAGAFVALLCGCSHEAGGAGDGAHAGPKGPVQAFASSLSGFDVRFRTTHFDLSHVDLARVVVRSRRGEPILRADALHLSLRLRELLPGGTQGLAVSALSIVHPQLTLSRRKDGTFNFSQPASPGGKPSTFGPPFDVVARVRDGTLTLLDPFNRIPAARRIRVANVEAAATLRPDVPSRFTASLALERDGRRYPVRGAGTLDDAHGREDAHFTGRELPLGPLIDYALDTSAVHFAATDVHDLDLRLYALPDARGVLRRHLAATTFLRGGMLYLGGIAKPVRDIHGRIDVYDDGLIFKRLDASISGVPVVADGGLYDFAAPKFRLGVDGAGPLTELLALSTQGKKLVLSGPLGFGILVEGAAAKPLLFAQVSSTRILYDGRIPILGAHGFVALNGTEVDVLRSELRYGGLALGAQGRAILEKHTNVRLLARVRGDAAALPYAEQFVPGMPLDALALATGVDANLTTTGLVSGTTRAQRLAAVFTVDGAGVGSIGPIAIDGPGASSLYARVALDRPHGTAAAVVSAHALHLPPAATRRNPLPGIATPTLPAIDGTLDGGLVAASRGAQVALGGSLEVSHAHAAGVVIDDARLDARGGGRGLHLANLSARGPWGALTGSGEAYGDGGAALDAEYRGDLATLGRVAHLPQTGGTADVPLAVVYSRGRLLAQIRGMRLGGARVRGVPIGGLAATLGARDAGTARARYDVYAAQARLAGGSLTASGSLGAANALVLGAGNLGLTQLGAPVAAAGGRLSAVAEVGGSLRAPSARAGVVVSGIRAHGVRLGASTALAFSGETLHLTDGLAVLGPASVALDGTVRGLRPGAIAPRYDLAARTRAADLGALATAAGRTAMPLAGTADADVRIVGSGAAPRIAGRLAIPEGSVNGLPFRNVDVAFAGTPREMRLRDGTATVGGTQARFLADLGARAQRVQFNVPHLELTDFNDFFDEGETLGGHGYLSGTVALSPRGVRADGDASITGLRYHRFRLGTLAATVATHGRTIAQHVNLRGPSGDFDLVGDVVVPRTEPLRDLAHRADVDLALHERGIDLATWLPAAGFKAPVIGTIDADARVRGRYPDLDLHARADVADGRYDRIPITQFGVTANAVRGRVSISRAVFSIPNLTASGTGTLGLRPTDPLSLSLRADAPDLAALTRTVTGKKSDVTGALLTVATITGTPTRPLLHDEATLNNLTYQRYVVPRIATRANVRKDVVDLQAAEVDLQRGRILASARLPLNPAGGIGPASAAITSALQIEGLDLAQFATLLPKGTKIGGAVNGRVDLHGTVGTPQLAGGAQLAQFAYVGPQERAPITNGVAHLAFSGSSAKLTGAHFAVGGGTIDAVGTASVPSLLQPARDLTARLDAHLTNAGIDAPQYLRGKIDGTITVVKSPNETARLGGDVALRQTRIPLTAIFNPSPPKTQGTPPPPPPLALDLTATAVRDVRVQSGQVDVGAVGKVHVGGTLAGLQLAGEFDSTDGTLDFYRSFRVQSGRVTFAPEDGAVPTVDALATTEVPQPDTQITLHVTGLASQLNVALDSSPSYDRAQILGLLLGVQQLGAVNGVASGDAGNATQSNLIASAATAQVSTLFTRNVLEPLSGVLGQALGLKTLTLGYQPGGGFNVGARQKLIKHVDAVFADSLGPQPRQTLGLTFEPSDATAAQFTLFNQPGSGQYLNQGNPAYQVSSNPSVTAGQPLNGTRGYSFTLLRRFK